MFSAKNKEIKNLTNGEKKVSQYRHLYILLPPYQSPVQDYKNTNVNSIQKALNIIDWNKFLSNANVEKQVNILNDTLFNIS